MSDAWIGVVGTLLGASLGYIASYLIERSRRGFEKSRRFEDERRASFVRLIEAAAEVERAIRDGHVDVLVARDRPDLPVDIRPRPNYDKIDLAVAEIRLLSRSSVDRAATIYVVGLRSLDHASGPWPDDMDEDAFEARWNEASIAVIRDHTVFIRAAKADLELPSGVMTKWQERRWRLKKRVRTTIQRKPKAPPDARRGT